MPFSHVVSVAFFVAVFGALSWYLVPSKALRFSQDNILVIRTSILLTLVCCYLMWAVVYLAQMNPLVAPIRSDLRGLEKDTVGDGTKVSMWDI